MNKMSYSCCSADGLLKQNKVDTSGICRYILI